MNPYDRAAVGTGNPAPRTDRPRWEYKVVDTGVTKNHTVSRLEEMLNEYGAEGWELIRSTPNSPTAFSRAAVQYIFKRLA
jgi:hypothetical protein